MLISLFSSLLFPGRLFPSPSRVRVYSFPWFSGARCRGFLAKAVYVVILGASVTPWSVRWWLSVWSMEYVKNDSSGTSAICLRKISPSSFPLLFSLVLLIMWFFIAYLAFAFNLLQAAFRVLLVRVLRSMDASVLGFQWCKTIKDRIKVGAGLSKIVRILLSCLCFRS